MVIWTVIGVVAGLLLFALGFGWGSAWQQRQQANRRWSRLNHPVDLDRLVREAVELGEDDEPREPWPFGSSLWGA